MALTTIDDRGLKTPIDLLDNEQIRFGTGSDLYIYHDGTYSYLKNTPAGGLYFASPITAITNLAVTENIARFHADGDVELYYDASKKLETTASGVSISGELQVEDVEGTTLRLGNTAAAASDGDYLSGIDFHIKDNNDATGAVCAAIRSHADQNHTASAKGTYLTFHTTDDDTTTLDERIRIAHDGKVGIGITSPNNLLHIKDPTTSGAKDIFHVESDGGGHFLVKCNDTAAANPGWQLRTYATEDIQISPGNNVVMHLDAADQKVGIGTTDPVGGDFVVENTTGTAGVALSRVFSGNVASSAVNTPSFAFTLSDTATNDQVVASISPQALAGTGDAFKGHMRIFTANDAGTSTEKLRILSGGGITFNGDTAAANAIDDYEEGTWTPTVFGSTTAGSFSYEAVRTGGKYTKIGNLVYIEGVVRISSITTAGAGALNFGGLPYAFGSNIASSWNEGTGIQVTHYAAGSNSSVSDYPPPFIAIGPPSGTTFVAYSYGKNYAAASDITDLSAANWIYQIAGCYQV